MISVFKQKKVTSHVSAHYHVKSTRFSFKRSLLGARFQMASHIVEIESKMSNLLVGLSLDGYYNATRLFL